MQVPLTSKYEFMQGQKKVAVNERWRVESQEVQAEALVQVRH